MTNGLPRRVLLARLPLLWLATPAAVALDASWNAGMAGSKPAARPLNPSSDSGKTLFRRVLLGGGGFVTDIDMSPDGSTRLIKTDVYGCYIWDIDSDPRGRWRQLVTRESMLDGVPEFGQSIGCYFVCCAPSQPTRIYMATATPGDKADPRQTLFRSDDRGRTFRKTSFPAMLLNYQTRMYGPKMAVHPQDPDIIYVGNTLGEIFRSSDGGSNWEQVAGIPSGESPAISFDPMGQKIYIATGANGIYASRNAGRTWEKSSGGPAIVKRMVCDAQGRLWATEANVGGQNAWRLRDEQWTKLKPSQGDGWHSIAVSAHDPNQVCLGYSAGNIVHSYDGGHSWTGFYDSAPIRTYTDIPWLAWTREDWFSNGNMAFDPVVPNKLWCANGIGVWFTHPRRDAARPNWQELTRGNDELIVNTVLKPPSGAVVISCQDRAFFRLSDLNAYPAMHGPANDAPIRHGWGLDYATDDPSFIVGIAADKSGSSSDGGLTWTSFASLPAGGIHWGGGNIAAASKSNFVWFPSNNGWPHFTKDGGKTWERCRFPSPLTQMSHAPGWSFSFYTNRHILCVERSTGYYYAYNYEAWGPSGDVSGVWRSIDGGANWHRMGRGFDTPGAMGTGAKLAAVPGQPGHLFFAIGTAGGVRPYNVSVYQTKDGGATWKQLGGFDENWTITFGKSAPGRNYPAIYVAGIKDRTPGIFRSDDEGRTWVALADDYGTLDGIRDMAGDMDEHGTVYVGLAGSGVIYGKLN